MKRSPVNRRDVARAARELDLEDFNAALDRAVVEHLLVLHREPIDAADVAELAELSTPRRAA